MARIKRTTRERLQKKREKLAKLQQKRSNLIIEKKNTLERARTKARQQFSAIGKNKTGIGFKIRGGEFVQTKEKQITLGEDAEEGDKYNKLEENIKDSNEKIWQTERDIRKLDRKDAQERKKKENDGNNNTFLGRLMTHNIYSRAKQERKDIREPRQQGLKYNRGRVR